MAISITRFPSQVTEFVKEANQELKKVSWPSRETTLRYTVIVIIVSTVVGMVTGGMDYVLTFILERFVL